MFEVNACDAIRLGLASPRSILDWSHGEVTRADTINYRTQRPEFGGLFCERIFGPTRDWECFCGKYRGSKHAEKRCDKCGVEVAAEWVRRERMGHITLAAPVAHLWYWGGAPSRLALLLDISPRHLEQVLYFGLYIVTSIREEERARALAEVMGASGSELMARGSQLLMPRDLLDDA